MERHYYRCRQCSEPIAIDGPQQQDIKCDCGGSMKHMGKVHGNHWHRTADLPPCDGKCTNASGPSCDCQCGGVNHGTQRLITVTVESGSVSVKPRPDLDKRLAKIAADKTARAAAIDRVIQATHGAFQDYLEGKFIANKSLWFDCRAYHEELHKADSRVNGRSVAYEKIAGRSC